MRLLDELAERLDGIAGCEKILGPVIDSLRAELTALRADRDQWEAQYEDLKKWYDDANADAIRWKARAEAQPEAVNGLVDALRNIRDDIGGFSGKWSFDIATFALKQYEESKAK